MTRFERCLSLFVCCLWFRFRLYDRYSILFQNIFSRHFKDHVTWHQLLRNIPPTKSSYMPPKLRREVAEKAGAYYHKNGGEVEFRMNLGGNKPRWIWYFILCLGNYKLEISLPNSRRLFGQQQIHKWKTSSVFQESGVHRSQVEGRCVLLFSRVLPWTLLAVGAFWRMVFFRSNKNPKKRMMS